MTCCGASAIFSEQIFLLFFILFILFIFFDTHEFLVICALR